MSEQAKAPVLPLRDVVVFPHMAIPLFVGREKSIAALETAMTEDKKILLIAQKAAETDDPGAEDLYEVGTLAGILQLLKLPDGTVKVLVEGGERARLLELEEDEQGLAATWAPLVDDEPSGPETDALLRSAVSTFESYVKLNKKVPAELLPSLSSMDAPGRLADTIAAHLNLKLDEKQDVLEMADAYARLEHVIAKTDAAMEVLQIERRMRGRDKQEMEKAQRA